jgi:hypothetical protein
MRHYSGEFSGIRLLMADELDAVSGGDGDDTDDVPTEEIIIVGNRWYVPFPLSYYGGGGGTATPNTPEGTDQSSVQVEVNLNRTLTNEELAAVDALNNAIRAATQAINNIPNNAQITLPNGSTVSGAELKAMWASTDFRINEAGTGYANGTTRGEADYAGGNPLISFNIDTVKGYNAHGAAGMNYLIGHELGHMTNAGRAYDTAAASGGYTPAETAYSEQLANDISRAIANAGGLQYLTNPTYGFSTPSPLVFQP